jgi:TolB-like protein/DNA-binding winged helix-turn-helix (wHTH) protein/Flp pilus assembly protein TadD
MPEAGQPFRRVSFASFEVDLHTGELRKNGVPIKLQAQPFQLLEMLLERPGDVVSRDELKRRLWPADSFGDFDHGLNKSINKIREALGDSALNPRFIETVSRRGYRFIANVIASDAALRGVEQLIAETTGSLEADGIAGPLAETPSGSGLKRFRWPLVAGSLLAISSLLVIWSVRPASDHAAQVRSIAVLPLENLSNDEAQEYFADGMTDELITTLGSVSGLRVISRSSAMLYKHVRKPLRQIGRELNVDAVVEGTVLRSGDQVRITAQLIRATTDEHLWSQSYRGDFRQALQLQDEVAQSIVDQIRVKITPHERRILNAATGINPDAHDAYLKGRYSWNKRTADGLQKAAAYFTEATKIDPQYAQAYSGLADSYALLGDWEYGVLDPKEAFPKAKAAARKALALNADLGEAHASLALCLKSFDWDWNSAEKELKQALKLNPNYASAHQRYGWLLMILGRHNEGISELKKAEALDPLSLIISADIADAFLIDRRYTASMQQSRRTIEMDPTFAMAHFQFGQALIATRQYDKAIGQLQQAIELSRRNPICTSHLGYVYAQTGRKTESMKILAELENDSGQVYRTASDVALIYTGLNERDQAFAWLEKAYESRFNPSILMRPAFDPLRSDPRFQNLLRRLALPSQRY